MLRLFTTHHAGRLLALEEGHGPIEVAPGTLDTLGGWSFDGKLPRNMTAHPKIDPRTGELLFFANFPDGRLTGDLALYAADAAGRLMRSERIQGPLPSLIHDFAITRDFVIFAFCPVTVSMRRARDGKSPIAWEPELGTHVAILPRGAPASEVRWFEGESCMVWHFMNAFNEDGQIIVDVCQQDVPMFPLADGTPPDHRRASQLLTRWSFEWERPKAFKVRRLYERECEYPRIDERRAGLPYRHGYVACLGGPGTDDIFQRGIGHFDHQTGEMRVYAAGPRCAVAEPVFAPRPGRAQEGEGYLLTHIFDEDRNASHLAILDASRVEEGPIARAHLDHRVPVGFHGCWRSG